MLEIGSGATLSLLAGAASGQTVDFMAGTGLLDLTKPAAFAGTLAGFDGSDQIDLIKTAETSFNYAGNTLTVKDGTKTVASLQFSGSYNTGSFMLGSDGMGELSLPSADAGKGQARRNAILKQRAAAFSFGFSRMLGNRHLLFWWAWALWPHRKIADWREQPVQRYAAIVEIF